MIEPSRTMKSARNLVVSVFAQVVILVLAIATRSLFIAQLDTITLGINAVFLGLISVLSLADLGLGAAVTYSLYKPLADQDMKRVAAIVDFAQTVFRFVALAVIVFGVGLIPFLGVITNGDADGRYFNVCYLVLLADTVVTYLTAHRSVLLMADQRLYQVKLYYLVAQVVRYGAQIWLLLALQSYLWYLVAQVVATLLGNAILYWRTSRQYADLWNSPRALHQAERASIIANVRAMFAYRLGGVLLNQTDTIIIAVLVGTVAAGIYSNYVLIVGAVLTFTELGFLALISSVGQLNATGGPDRRRLVFDEVDLLAFWTHGAIAVVLMTTLNEVVAVWLGTDFVIDSWSVLALVLNFYAYGMMASLGVFRNTTGLFRRTRYVILGTACVNLVLSFLLGQSFGIAGILFATFLARLLTQVWYEPLMLFRHHLMGRSIDYFGKQLFYLLLVAVSFLVVQAALVPLEPGTWSWFVVAFALAALVPNAVFLLALGRTPAARRLCGRARNLVSSALMKRAM